MIHLTKFQTTEIKPGVRYTLATTPVPNGQVKSFDIYPNNRDLFCYPCDIPISLTKTCYEQRSGPNEHSHPNYQYSVGYLVLVNDTVEFHIYRD